MTNPRKTLDNSGRLGPIGNGKEPLVLLHGIGSSARIWVDVFDDLAKHFNVFALTYPGHGGTPSPGAKQSAQSLAEFVIAQLDGVPGFEGKAHFVGVSLGGTVALEILRTRPERVRKVCVIGPGDAGDLESIKLATEDIRTTVELAKKRSASIHTVAVIPAKRRWVLALIALHGDRVSQETFEEFLTDLVTCEAQVLEELLQPFSFQPLEAGGDKATLIWGIDDALFPFQPNAGIAMASILGSKLAEIEDAGHLTFLDRPAKTVAFILKALK